MQNLADSAVLRHDPQSAMSTVTIEQAVPGVMLGRELLAPNSGPVTELIVTAVLVVVFTIVVHVVMSLQRSTTARSTRWRALLAAVAGSVAAVAASNIAYRLFRISFASSLVFVLCFELFGLIIAIRALYLTSVSRAVASALAACVLTPAMVALFVALVL